MEIENNSVTIKIDIEDGESWFDQLEDDSEFKEYKNRKTSAGVSIYRVPESMKRSNREGYDPLVVFLGPFHHKKEQEMTVMDEYKLQAVDSTLKRIPGMNRKELALKVRELDNNIRDCYEDSAAEWNEVTLSWIMTLDACFILEFLRMDLPNSSFLFHSQRAHNIKRREIMVDILKMENQIPFCVLKRILELESKDPVPFLAERLNGSMYKYFRGFPFKVSPPHDEELIAKLIKGGVSHLLDLSRQVIADFLSNSASGSKADHDDVKSCACNVQCGASACIATPNGVGCFRKSWWNRLLWLHSLFEVDHSTIPSAVKLQEAGIKLKEDQKRKIPL